MWGHEYVITSLLENAVSWKIKRGGPHPLRLRTLTTSFGATRTVCVEGALTWLVVQLRASMVPGKGMEDKDKPDQTVTYFLISSPLDWRRKR